MKKYAIIVAGGSGVRMGSSIPKQFLLLNDKPIIVYSVLAFLHAYNDIEIILVLPENYIAEGKRIITAFGLPADKINAVAGGQTRFHSVQNGLMEVKDEAVVFVHDAVRCLVSADLIKKL